MQTEGKSRKITPRGLRLSIVLGLASGFIYSYNRSVQRFLGIIENEREVEKDRYEIKSRLAKGLKPYGETDLNPWLQKVAARNSTYSSTFSHVLPWFNFVHHEYHGVDLNKYYEVREGEEKWGFDLQVPEGQDA